MQCVAICSYQYTKYKHLAMPKIDITQCTLQSVQLLSPIKQSVNTGPVIQHHVATDKIHVLAASLTPACYDLQYTPATT